MANSAIDWYNFSTKVGNQSIYSCNIIELKIVFKKSEILVKKYELPI